MAKTAPPKSPAAAKAGKGSNPLGLAIAGIVLLVVAITAGTAALISTTEAGRAAQSQVSKELGGSQSVQTALQQQRYQRLNLISRIFATDQVLTSYLAEAAQARDETAILASVEEYQNLLTFDLAVVLDRDGVVLTRTDRTGVGEDLSDTPLVSVALEESKASGVWQQGDQLYHAVAVPLVRQFELVGYIAVAYSVNNTLAMQIKRTGGAEIVFLADSGTGPVPTVSTLNENRSASLVEALRKQGDVLGRVMGQGETANDIELELDGDQFVAFLSPLRDAAGGSLGAVVALTSVADKLGRFERIRLLSLAAGLVALALGALLGLMLAARAQRPMALLADAATRGASGQWDVDVPSVGGDAGRIGEALRGLFAGLREKSAAEFVANRVARLLPEPAHGTSTSKPASDQACLVGVEMHRFSDPKIGYDPEESLQRFDRDLQRIATSTSTQKGKLVGIFGHRALLQFTGEHHTYRALCAATEIALTLKERESVFDEPQPPTVALAIGPVVTGSVQAAGRTSEAVVGVAVPALERLMREAAPGMIYFTKEAYPHLANLLQRSQVETKGQHSRLGGDPLYYIDTDSAARATGAEALGDGAGGGEGRSFADLRPGLLLANRFEILAELGAGPMAIVLKANDRNLGDLVTLKMLRPEVVRDAAIFERLKRSVSRARGIRHPNVLSVLDFGEAERMPYIEMEFARGTTLAFALAHAGQLPALASLRIARQIAWALAAAHGQQVMHGGLKPDNILLEGNGDVKVMDFGTGMPIRPNQPIANPGFLAPEQLESKEADSRADFYSFGAVVYAMVTGQLPYPGTTAEEVRQQMANGPPAPPTAMAGDMSPRLEQIVLRCLSPDPAARYDSIDAIVKDLEAID